MTPEQVAQKLVLLDLYDRIDAGAVYAIVRDDLGDLEELARLYVDALRA